MRTAREIALEGIYKINEEDGFSNLVVNSLLNRSNLDKRDRSLATQLIYGVIRRRNTLDWIINKFASRKINKMTPWVRNSLRLGVYQVYYLDKIPTPVAVNETVEAAKSKCNRGAIKFINGVLRNIIRSLDKIEYPKLEKDPVQYIRYKYSQPQWLVERWVKIYGTKKAIEIAENLNKVPATVIRTNTLKTDREALIQELSEDKVDAETIALVPEAINLLKYPSIDRLKAFEEGRFQVQGLASMLVAHILAPEADDKVVDLCSAPGGKTTHLSQLMDNRGQVYAVDVHQHKLDLIHQNCDRLGIDNVETICNDGREVSFAEKIDKVLVDAPCSGLGIMAKKPEIRWQKKPQDLAELQQLQVELLENGAKMLKDGGVLVYSTCTFTDEENIDIIREFLEDHDNFKLVDLSKDAERFGLTEYLKEGTLQLIPDEDLIEGFFIAKLLKGSK
ncbi:16S rRNA (cytosine(967)-C(5))-methyltransferase [Orenia metallireducens]|uniref:16S rRNA (cytosine(967)-C(5))-methyltransferase n=1 Tax=Orenia metallireducens TaxID=1413210 RepID=A0A1C0AC13_9FIRM|nr:16S rRNA (cytosine(967)-C(5))-methyltransferase RsmB [Orenia metallireducens]OCL27933.1 16S rRNA (cytosine(967)-C(5))-methyltransferase [Orenia metallireducens]